MKLLRFGKILFGRESVVFKRDGSVMNPSLYLRVFLVGLCSNEKNVWRKWGAYLLCKSQSARVTAWNAVDTSDSEMPANLTQPLFSLIREGFSTHQY